MPPSRESPIFTSIGFSPVPYRVISTREQQGHTPFPYTHQALRHILALVSALDNCRIYLRLNRGMRYTLETRRLTTKSGCAGGRIGKDSTPQHPVSGMQNSVEHRTFVSFCRQNRVRGTSGAVDLEGNSLVVLSYRRSASCESQCQRQTGKLKMCSQVAPGLKRNNESVEACFFILSWHYKKALLINLLQRTGHYQSK